MLSLLRRRRRQHDAPALAQGAHPARPLLTVRGLLKRNFLVWRAE